MSSTMSRRSFAVGSFVSLLGASSVSSLLTLQNAVAQGSGDLASLGLPTLDISVSDNAFSGVGDQIDAGRYLVSFTVPDSMTEGGSAAFMSPPAGMTAQDFLMQAGVGGGGGGGATPDASASPEAGGGEEMGGPPPLFIYKATFAGGASGMPGQAAQSVIDLTPGEWILWGDDPSASAQPFIFTVTGEMPADLSEPQADITTTFIDFGINVEGSLTAGDHIMQLQNHGAQPHFLFLAKGPDEVTNDMVSQILEAEMTGATPEGLPFDPNTELMPVLISATQSIGTTQWVPVSMEAGTYVGLCFFPTAGEGMPHAYHGMHTVIKVQ